MADGPGPDWYADPTGRHQWRYWDGTAWTDQVADGGVVGQDPPTLTPVRGPEAAPTASGDAADSTGVWGPPGPGDGTTPIPAAAPSAVPPSAPAAPGGWQVPTPTPPGAGANGLAIAAMVCGIVALVSGLVVVFFFVALPLGGVALGLGIAGRRRAGRRPDRRGRGQATAGIVTGSLGMALGVVGIVLVIFVIDWDDSYELTSTECRYQDGEAVAAGTIESVAVGSERSWEVVVAFEDDEGRTVATGSDLVRDVGFGEEERFRVAVPVDVVDVDSCRVVDVSSVD